MISSIASLSPAQPVAPAPPVQQTAVAAPHPRPTDSVQISNSAKALLQESMENSMQTAQEARSGDIQAIHLQAREAAAKASAQ